MKSANKFYSISEINSLVKELFDNNSLLSNITIKGEISNFKSYPKAFYFTLKDDISQISAVMFFNFRPKLDFSPTDGDEVLVFGSLKVYEKTGRYQVVVDDMILYGAGLQLLKLQELKRKLEAEGLFDPSRKRPLPRYPNNIGIIAGNDSAAFKDVYTNIRRRFPIAQLYFFPSLVQGKTAPGDIIRALSLAYTYHLDTLIIARGGGSEEDLSAFNDEAVVRHIATSPIPTIGAIGHEINTTLADLVCDKRASTPTGAAELATRDMGDINYEINMLEQRMYEALTNRLDVVKLAFFRLKEKPYFVTPSSMYDKHLKDIEVIKEKLKGYLNELVFANHQVINKTKEKLVNPYVKLNEYKMINSNRRDYLNNIIKSLLETSKAQVSGLKDHLKALSPYEVLNRGYGLVTSVDGTIVTSSLQVAIGDNITTTLKHGKIKSVVKERD